MGKPFKVSTAPAAAPPPAPRPAITPMEVFKEADRTGQDVFKVGQEHTGVDGETPIPWPAAVPVQGKPFKLR